MHPLKIEQVTKAIKATRTPCINPPQEDIYGVSTDTRDLKAGDLFVPLIGESFDGHDFLREAFDKGAVACLCEEGQYERMLPVFHDKILLAVQNTQQALLDLSGFYKDQFKIPFVAVTGSVGKTTTKDMIASVLSEKFCVLKSRENFNNEIGLPLTLFDLDQRHELGVVEMGMRGLGEIRRLAETVRPDAGVITNIGISHIERLQSKKNIAKAKLELFEAMGSDAIAIMNGDSPQLWEARNTLSLNTVYFGTERGDIKAGGIASKGQEGMEFDICGKYGKGHFRISLPGLHNVYNALPAIALGYYFGLSENEIKRGFDNLKPSKMRLEIRKTPLGATLIDDTYNASPDSVKAALELLEISGENRVAILGDMFELGEFAPMSHFEIGKFCAPRAELLIAVGGFSDTIARGALQAGMREDKIFTFSSTQEAFDKVEKIISHCDAILVKGSRGMKMEQISQRLVGRV